MRPQVALPSLLIVVLLGVLALTGCGGGDDGSDASASELIQQTFGSDAELDTGRLALGIDARLKDSGTLDAQLDARFAKAGDGQLPRFAGTLTFDSDSGSLEAGAISTGDKGYVMIAGQAYEVDAAQWKTFTDGYLSDQKETDKQRSAQPTLSGLGIHPEQWLTAPKKDGKGEIDGVETIHITAGVDIARMLADVSKLAEKNGATETLGAAELDELKKGVKSATVEVDTGAEDQRLRRLVIHLVLESGTVDFSVQYTELDQPQEITAPTDARPLSELTDALGAATGQDSSSGQQTTPQGTGSGNDEYLQCLQDAGQDVAKVQACAQYL